MLEWFDSAVQMKIANDCSTSKTIQNDWGMPVAHASLPTSEWCYLWYLHVVCVVCNRQCQSSWKGVKLWIVYPLLRRARNESHNLALARIWSHWQQTVPGSIFKAFQSMATQGHQVQELYFVLERRPRRWWVCLCVCAVLRVSQNAIQRAQARFVGGTQTEYGMQCTESVVIPKRMHGKTLWKFESKCIFTNQLQRIAKLMLNKYWLAATGCDWCWLLCVSLERNWKTP